MATWFFLTNYQVLTGELPFHVIKPQEHAYCVLHGARPDKPANAGAIGISDSLWEVMQKCWERDKVRRPRIQEVVEGISGAAANWRTDMPPGGRKQREDYTVEDDTDELEGGEFKPIPNVTPFVLRPSMQLEYSNPTWAMTGHMTCSPSEPNTPIPSLCSGTQPMMACQYHPLLPLHHGNAKDSNAIWVGLQKFLGAIRSILYFYRHPTLDSYPPPRAFHGFPTVQIDIFVSFGCDTQEKWSGSV